MTRNALARARPSDLPASRDPVKIKRAAAWKGAAAAALPSLALLASAPTLVAYSIPKLIALFHGLLPFSTSFYATLAVVSFGPALLALPVAATSAVVARSQGKRDRDLGLAAAAGASMGAAALTTAFLAWSLLTSVEIVLAAPLMAASALAVGVVGGAAFMAVPRDRKKDPQVPALYQGLTAAGVGVPALVVGGGAWSALTYLFPLLSAGAMRAVLPATAAGVAYPLLFLGALSPLTYLMARAWKRRLPDLDKKAVAAGLAFPPLLPFLILGASLATRMTMSTTLVALLLGNLLGVAPHLAAIVLGLRDREGAAKRLAPRTAASEATAPPADATGATAVPPPATEAAGA